MLTPRKHHPTLSIPTTLERLGRRWPVALINAHTRPADVMLLLLLVVLVYLGLSNDHSSRGHRRSRGGRLELVMVMVLMLIRGRSFRGWIEVHVHEKNEKRTTDRYKQTYLINQFHYLRGFNSVPLEGEKKSFSDTNTRASTSSQTHPSRPHPLRLCECRLSENYLHNASKLPSNPQKNFTGNPASSNLPLGGGASGPWALFPPALAARRPFSCSMHSGSHVHTWSLQSRCIYGIKDLGSEMRFNITSSGTRAPFLELEEVETGCVLRLESR